MLKLVPTLVVNEVIAATNAENLKFNLPKYRHQDSEVSAKVGNFRLVVTNDRINGASLDVRNLRTNRSLLKISSEDLEQTGVSPKAAKIQMLELWLLAKAGACNQTSLFRVLENPVT